MSMALFLSSVNTMCKKRDTKRYLAMAIYCFTIFNFKKTLASREGIA